MWIENEPFIFFTEEILVGLKSLVHTNPTVPLCAVAFGRTSDDGSGETGGGQTSKHLLSDGQIRAGLVVKGAALLRLC